MNNTNFLINIFFAIKKLVFSLISHKACRYCKKTISINSYFCNTCLDSLSFFVPKFHKKSKILIYYLGRYDGFLRFVVNQKYHKNILAYYGLEKKIIAIFDLYKITHSFDIIIPVPKSSLSKIKHTFNPSEIIATMIKNHYQKEILNIYIKKFKSRQVTLSYQERKKNNKELFFIPRSDEAILINKRILIIDDVYTTGATIEGMIDALKNISYCSISVFTLAIG